VERCFCFVPLDTRVLDPEVGVPTLSPIGHPVGIEELESKVEAAHLAIFVEAPDRLVPQGILVTPLQRMRGIVCGRCSRIPHDIDRSVTKRHGAPVAKLLTRFDCLASLQFCQHEVLSTLNLSLNAPGVAKIPLASLLASPRSRPTATSNTSNWARHRSPFGPVTLFFTDRPERIAGNMKTAAFIPRWSEGEDSFKSDPPNADVSMLEGSTLRQIGVVLHDPVLEGDNLTYAVKALEGEMPAGAADISLFIDIIGMPLTPLSYAGVARRSYRRAYRYR
jgi:hypothetical protein